MAEIIKMPLLSDTMTEGVVAVWHKEVGDSMSIGDLLAEIETDKATMDFEASFDGVLLYIGVEAGDAIPIGDILAIVGEKGEDISSLLSSAGTVQPASPQATKSAVAASSATQTTTVALPTNGERVKASPLAKAMAKEQGIDLHTVVGTGENGRIIKRDIEAMGGESGLRSETKPPVVETVAAQPQVSRKPMAPSTADYNEVRVSQMRKTIARRLGESKFSAPHFYITMAISMDKAVAFRTSLNEISPVKISYNDIVVKATAAAIKQHPGVNASWLGDVMHFHNEINIGVAVAVDDGLLVPVIRNADQKGLSDINAEVKDKAGRARDKKLSPDEWEGNTFTISNLGMFGVDEFTAIINSPDVCILAIGGIHDTPVVKNGEIVPGKVMKVTLSSDHRVVDGATAAAFLQTLKGLLEDPMRMLL